MSIIEIRDSKAGTDAASQGPGVPLVWADGFVVWPNGLGLDTLSPTGFSFISNAHVNPPPGRILATSTTFKLMSRRVPESDRLTATFEQPFKLGPLELTLVPAGTIPGSAQLLINVKGTRILYASGVQTSVPLAAERIRIPKADLLILGQKDMPPAQLVSPRRTAERAAAWAIETSSAGFTPVFITQPLGLAQALARVLVEKGIRPRVHRHIYEVAGVYEKYGIRVEGVRRLDAKPDGWDAVILPRDLGNSPVWKSLGRTRTALVGPYTDPVRVGEFDDVFRMSNGVDRRGLVKYVAATGCRRVALSPVYADSFAKALARRSIEVYHFREPSQLSLRLEAGKKRGRK